MSQSFVKAQLWQTFHPLSIILYFLLLGIMAAVYTHPVYLGWLFLLTAAGIVSMGAGKQWISYMRFSLVMCFFIVLLNIVFSRNGKTILWIGPSLPIIGDVIISQEAFLYGLNMAFKLSLILSIFCFYESVMPADKSFVFFSRFTPKSALSLILTSLMVPQLKRRLEEISVVMQVRGALVNDRNLWQAVRSRYPFWKVLLLSALEDSWQTAEALSARGFGVGKRSSFIQHRWQRKDTLLLACLIFSFAGFMVSVIQKKGFLNFYPILDPGWNSSEGLRLGFIFSGLFSILIFSELWKRWPYLRSII